MSAEDTGKGCGKEIGKHMLVALLLLAVLLGPCGAAVIESLRANAAPAEEVGPPVGAIQILGDNTSLENGSVPWTFMGNVGLTMETAYDGDYSMKLGGVSSWGMASIDFDLTPCAVTSPVWVRAAYSIVVVPPLTDPGYDVSEGWITDEAGAWMVSLWSRYDYDYESDARWHDPWIMVEGLQQAISSGKLYIGGVTNEHPTYFFHDVIEMWCMPEMAYRLFLPVVKR